MRREGHGIALHDYIDADINLGLSYFPRCPGLLFLRGFVYHDQKKYACAIQYYNYSRTRTSTVLNDYMDTSYFMFKAFENNFTVSNMNQIDATLWGGSTDGCLPSPIAVTSVYTSSSEGLGSTGMMPIHLNIGTTFDAIIQLPLTTVIVSPNYPNHPDHAPT